jgi:hypothetical protein
MLKQCFGVMAFIGLMLQEFELICRRLDGLSDLAHLAPGEGPVACAFLLAKLVYKFMGYVLP